MGVCGEIAVRPDVALALIALGVDLLSVVPTAIPELKYALSGADEHDVEERDVEPLGDGRYRLDASVPIHELNELLGTDFPRDRWNTVGGLMFGVLGTIPTEGQAVTMQGFCFTAEKVQGRRVTTVLVTPEVSQGA